MSIRWKFALALAVVAALVSFGAATGAYIATDRELRDATDEFLTERSNQFNEGQRGVRDNDLDAEVAISYETLADYDAVTQILDDTGKSVLALSLPRLPIEEIDIGVAIHQDKMVFRNVEIEGASFRMVTAPLAKGGAVQVARELTETERVLTGLLGSLVALGAGATALAASIGWVIAWRVTSPMQRLEASARHIALTEDLSVVVGEDKQQDEIGSLARSFNAMVTALRTSREQQHRLIMDASHELRTPLTSLRMNTEMLHHIDELDDEDRFKVITGLSAELGELTDLVSELVDLATDQADMEAVPEDVDLVDIAQRVIRRAERRYSVPITFSEDAAEIVQGIPGRIERVVTNLVDNALKHGRPPVSVTVSATSITVTDSGDGITQEALPHVFDRFYRANEARDRPGSGLGLSIVDQIIRDAGGTIEVMNRPEGGARFTASFPTSGATQPSQTRRWSARQPTQA